ncbi:MAG: nicotinate (nicotinamide) nucleotide adenylyltransferase, partial [Alphaproteobacteria bacterium]|nr:nicotinate (nicotinamide) nucleotide adenylyltransferase [Alphaproteobacteria bacterium]
LGDDILPTIHKWKNIDQLLLMAPPLVGTRSNLTDVPANLSPASMSALTNNLITISALDISSTTLRARIKKNLYSQHLIPSEVLEYIIKENLYK